MTKKKEGTWLTGKYAFISDPNHPDSQHSMLVIEWLYFEGDDDDPVRRQLQIVDAFQS